MVDEGNGEGNGGGWNGGEGNGRDGNGGEMVEWRERTQARVFGVRVFCVLCFRCV